MFVNRIGQRIHTSWHGFVLRLVAFVAVLSVATIGLGGTALASSYWWNGDRVEESWFSTHPTYYYYEYLSVDVSCGAPCTRWLDSSSSGLIASSGKIRHWPSGGSASSWLSCKWDTIGSGSVADLECYRGT
jgi:hypothetical protein